MHGLLVAGANRRVRWLGAAATVATLAVGGCATSGFERLPSLGVAELSGDEQLARISVNSHFFEPDRLIVQVGVRVRLLLVNDTLLAGHAATAIFASRLHSQSKRKLSTIQGFIDLLTK